MPKDAKRLKAWQLADELAAMVYEATKPFPPSELYGLISQMRRCAVSAPANITEGAARKGQHELLQFLYIASSSLSELGYYIHFSNRLGYLSKEPHARLRVLHTESARTLQGLINKIETDLNVKQ